MKKYPYLPWIILIAGAIYATKLVQKIKVPPGKTSVEKFEEKYGKIE